MPVQKLLAKIHIAKKELALDDETYQGLLKNMFRVSSSALLTNDQAASLIKEFIRKGFNPKPATRNPKPLKYDDQKGDLYSASPKQKRLIEVLWHNIYRGNSETLHLRQFLFNHFKVSDLRFCDKDKAHMAIEALKKMQMRRSPARPVGGGDGACRRGGRET